MANMYRSKVCAPCTQILLKWYRSTIHHNIRKQWDQLGTEIENLSRNGTQAHTHTPEQPKSTKLTQLTIKLSKTNHFKCFQSLWNERTTYTFEEKKSLRIWISIGIWKINLKMKKRNGRYIQLNNAILESRLAHFINQLIYSSIAFSMSWIVRANALSC